MTHAAAKGEWQPALIGDAAHVLLTHRNVGLGETVLKAGERVRIRKVPLTPRGWRVHERLSGCTVGPACAVEMHPEDRMRLWPGDDLMEIFCLGEFLTD